MHVCVWCKYVFVSICECLHVNVSSIITAPWNWVFATARHKCIEENSWQQASLAKTETLPTHYIHGQQLLTCNTWSWIEIARAEWVIWLCHLSSTAEPKVSLKKLVHSFQQLHFNCHIQNSLSCMQCSKQSDLEQLCMGSSMWLITLILSKISS